VINDDKTNIWKEKNSTEKREQSVNVRQLLRIKIEHFQKGGTIISFSKAGLTRQSFIEIPVYTVRSTIT
jgi:hypothetical protein